MRTSVPFVAVGGLAGAVTAFISPVGRLGQALAVAGRAPRRSFHRAALTMAEAGHFDYLVIGGGSGGIASARRAASYGAKVCGACCLQIRQILS
jgi:hypothetical protein